MENNAIKKTINFIEYNSDDNNNEKTHQIDGLKGRKGQFCYI
jgi:hypothetical protein